MKGLYKDNCKSKNRFRPSTGHQNNAITRLLVLVAVFVLGFMFMMVTCWLNLVSFH
ncbi:hypothetical protein Hanom_Chr16g01440751 [Helianthus anomalus]